METKISNQRIFEVISRDKEFFKFYLNDYFDRLLINNSINKEDILPLFIEFNNKKNMNIYPTDLLDFANSINSFNNKAGFRNYDFPNQEDHIYTPVKNSLVFQKFYSLLDCYRGLWKDLDPLEREAFFHIHLMRIYPFIYNNELICHLILISNLINNYYSPVIITGHEKENYHDTINSGDALKFKEMMLKNSLEELYIMEKLYKKYYLFPENITIEEIILQKTDF